MKRLFREGEAAAAPLILVAHALVAGSPAGSVGVVANTDWNRQVFQGSPQGVAVLYLYVLKVAQTVYVGGNGLLVFSTKGDQQVCLIGGPVHVEYLGALI